MDIQEVARQRLAQERQQAEHQADTLLSRAEEEVTTVTEATDLPEIAREHLTQARLHEELRDESMLTRSEQEIHDAS